MIKIIRCFHRYCSFLLLVMLLSSCNLSARITPASNVTEAIPSHILTEAAATILAGIPTPASDSDTSTLTFTSTTSAEAGDEVELSSTTTPTSLPTYTHTPFPSNTPTYTTTPTHTQVESSSTPIPTTTRRVTSGTHFLVDNINISQNCSVSLWVIFTIFNNGTSDLESMALGIFDITAQKNLLLPEANNYPFMLDEHTCTTGSIDSLVSGKVGYIGASLNAIDLSNHTLSATIKMCNGESLYEPCYQKTINFVVP